MFLLAPDAGTGVEPLINLTPWGGEAFQTRSKAFPNRFKTIPKPYHLSFVLSTVVILFSIAGVLQKRTKAFKSKLGPPGLQKQC